jgi:hypothetical protein
MYDIGVEVEYAAGDTEDDNNYRRCLLASFAVPVSSSDGEDGAEDPLDIINRGCDALLAQMLWCAPLVDIFRAAAHQQVLFEDPAIGLRIMFSYDNFYVFHVFLREFLPICIARENNVGAHVCNYNGDQDLIRALRHHVLGPT